MCSQVCAAVKYCLHLKDRIPKNSLLPEIVFVHIVLQYTWNYTHSCYQNIHRNLHNTKTKKPKTLVQRSPDFTVNMFISVYLSHSVTKTLCLNVISALFPFGCKQHCTAREVGPGRLRMVSFTCTCWKKIMIKMEKRYSFWKR